jgi:altronate hydrolase
MDDMLQELIDKVLKTANGDRVKHEQVGFKELAIFKSGVTL